MERLSGKSRKIVVTPSTKWGMVKNKKIEPMILSCGVVRGHALTDCFQQSTSICFNHSKTSQMKTHKKHATFIAMES
jgi:hypothetical protein